jgi:hypothetical protein
MKFEEQSDGSVVVHGLCTSDAEDLDSQIIDLDFSRKGLADWAESFGNVRQMHSTNLPPAGKAIEVDTSRPDGVYLTARIVEPTAVKLVKEGVYSAFSVGISKPRIVRDKVAKNGRVIDGVFSEVSVVDFPALPSAKFTVVKRQKDEIEKLEKTLTPVGTLYKRNFDPSVGGGVDRDKIPAEDFAGKDRSFPIVTPSDVADAAQSIGRAGEDNYSTEELKNNIIRIANRKGADFVAELPESWKNAEKAEEADIEKSADCKTCNGTGKIMEGNRDCPDCGPGDEVEKSAMQCEVCKGTGKVDGDDCMKCMGKGIESDVEKKGKIPEDDKEVTDALEEADEAVEEAQDAQAKDNAKHEAGMPEESSDDDDEEEAKKGLDVDLTYALRRAHDATCPAYSQGVVESVHPSVAKFGVKGVIDPDVVRSMITANATEESFDPEVIKELTEAFKAAKILANTPDSEIAAAREILSKAFEEDYPTAKPTPGSITPGEFKRPFIGTGRAPLSSTGAAPHIPYEGGSEVHASEFDRSLLTEGHEADSPSSTGSRPSETVSAADELASMARDHALVSLQNLHDHIASAYPDICALDTSSKPAAGIGAYAGAGIETMDMSGSLNSVKTTAAVPAIEKSEEAGDDAIVAEVEDGQQVLIDTEVLTSLVKTIMAEQLAVKFEEMNDAIKEVQSEVQKMASEPDPAQAPLRGTVTVERATVQKSVSEAEILRQKAEEELTQQVEYLTTLTKSGNPELRMRAQGQLEKLFERASMSVDN